MKDLIGIVYLTSDTKTQRMLQLESGEVALPPMSHDAHFKLKKGT